MPSRNEFRFRFVVYPEPEITTRNAPFHTQATEYPSSMCRRHMTSILVVFCKQSPPPIPSQKTKVEQPSSTHEPWHTRKMKSLLNEATRITDRCWVLKNLIFRHGYDSEMLENAVWVLLLDGENRGANGVHRGTG